MKINYEKLLEAFGVAEGEEFLLTNNACKDKFKFECGKLLWFDKLFNGWQESEIIEVNINELFMYEIEKIQWKPKDGETVWWICDCGDCVYSLVFNFDDSDGVALLKCGWLFRTKEEAEANRERVLKEMKEVMGE